MTDVYEICIECGAELPITPEMFVGEITSCPDCGKDYVVEKDDNGDKTLKELNLDGEDFGE